MGILYELYNFTRKEYTNIGKYPVNTKNWEWSPLANFYVWIKTHFWCYTDDVSLLPDTEDKYYYLREVFHDITKESIDGYNDFVRESIEFYVKDRGFSANILCEIPLWEVVQ